MKFIESSKNYAQKDPENFTNPLESLCDVKFGWTLRAQNIISFDPL